MEPVTVIYFGTPEYAVPSLRALAADPRYAVRLVVSQPDRPAGRGHQMVSPAVKTAAIELGLPVYQPASLRTAEARQPLVDADADLFVVAAYGLIFGARTLAIPRLGCLNLHASLLPAYRGAAPVAAALLAGDAVTGVTLMQMERGLDTGPVISMRELDVSPDATTGSLTTELGDLAARIVLADAIRFVNGELRPSPQPEQGATVVRPLVKGDGWLDFNQPAARLERQVRAMIPWPRAWTSDDGTTLQVLRAAVAVDPPVIVPGVVLGEKGRVLVGTVSGALELLEVQPAGSKAMAATAWLAGQRGRPIVLGGEAPGVPGPIVVPGLPSID